MSRTSTVLILKSVLFALLVPGTVTVVVPYLLAARRLPAVLDHWGALQSLSLAPVIIGAAVLVRCIWDLTAIGRGTLAHIDPPKQLVVKGLYRYVRNPMYLGALVLLLGEALTLQSVAILQWTVVWFLGINAVVIFYEEPTLRRRFGESYEQYRHSVRRWIPGTPVHGATQHAHEGRKAEMPSWRIRFFRLATRLVIRRRNWGEPRVLVQRARRVFGAPRLYQWMRTFGVHIAHTRDEGVVGEWISPPSPGSRTILYLHGGGYVSCSPATHRPITAALARLTPARVFALDYRLAPEHPFPAALDDAVRAYRWILASGVRPRTMALAGDSAGGGLALATLQRLRHEGTPLPACAVLMSPWTDLAGTGRSVQENDDLCDMFRPENIAAFARCYAPAHAWRESAVSPLYGPVDGLPPLHLQVGAEELLRDDALRLHERVRAVGGDSELVVVDGVFHGWQMLDGVVPEARTALTRSARFIHTLTKPVPF